MTERLADAPLARLFRPRSIAIVGASEDLSQSALSYASPTLPIEGRTPAS